MPATQRKKKKTLVRKRRRCFVVSRRACVHRGALCQRRSEGRGAFCLDTAASQVKRRQRAGKCLHRRILSESRAATGPREMASHRQILANHRSARRTHLGDERGALRPDRVLSENIAKYMPKICPKSGQISLNFSPNFVPRAARGCAAGNPPRRSPRRGGGSPAHKYHEFNRIQSNSIESIIRINWRIRTSAVR